MLLAKKSCRGNIKDIKKKPKKDRDPYTGCSSVPELIQWDTEKKCLSVRIDHVWAQRDSYDEKMINYYWYRHLIRHVKIGYLNSNLNEMKEHENHYCFTLGEYYDLIRFLHNYWYNNAGKRDDNKKNIIRFIL